MKKFTAILLFVSLMFSILPYQSIKMVANAAQSSEKVPIISEDFELCEAGVYKGPALTSVGNCADVVSSDGNQYIRVATDNGDIFQTSFYNFSPKTIFSFELTNTAQSQGSVKAAFRDSNKVIMDLVTVSGTKVTYLADIKKVTENINIGETLYITVVTDSSNGTVSIYKNGEYKAGCDNFKNTAKFSAFKLDNCLFRFDAGTGVTYCVDNFYISPVCSIDENLYCGIPDIYYRQNENSENESLCRISYLKSGPIVCNLQIVNTSSEESTVTLVLAHKSDGELLNVAASDTVIIPSYKSKIVSCLLTLGNINENDTLDIYILDNMQTISPLGTKNSYGYQTISVPLESELSFLFEYNAPVSHPRIMASANDFKYIKNETDSTYVEWKNSIISSANRILDYDANSYITRNEESIDQFLSVCRNVIGYMQSLGMAYQLTSDASYPQKAYEFMQRASSWGDWNPAHFLDVAEMTVAYAVAYDWMYDGFSVEEKKQIETWIYNYGLLPGIDAYNSTDGSGWWKRAEHNWNVVCNAGLITGAIALADIYPDDCFYIIKKAVESLNTALLNFAPDGAWDEGYAYIKAMYRSLLKSVSSLKVAFGTDFGLMKYEGMNKSGDFMIYLQGGNNRIMNFHDVSAVAFDASELMWLAKVYNRPDYASVRLNSIERLRLSPSVVDLLFYDKSYSSFKTNLPLAAYFRGTEYVSMRNSWDSDALCLSYHGGMADVSHGHVDCGTFILDALGERWACDLGAESYNAEGYFGDKRYLYYRTRAEGHNTLVINPDSSAGQEMDADTKVVSDVFNENEHISTLDLTSAYSSKAELVQRTYSLTDNLNKAIIKDKIVLKNDADVYWFMHTQADSVDITGNTATLTIGSKKLLVDFECSSEDAELSCVSAEPLIDLGVSNSKNSAYKKLQFKVAGAGVVLINVIFTPTMQ